MQPIRSAGRRKTADFLDKVNEQVPKRIANFRFDLTTTRIAYTIKLIKKPALAERRILWKIRI
jgi:hypothetical protein